MQGYDAEKAVAYILKHIDPKVARPVKNRLPELIREMIAYDLEYMRQTGVIDENGDQGENDYDDDEAFEAIYDAWLSDHPQEDDEDMKIAAVLNEYMELQYQYLQDEGLVDM